MSEKRQIRMLETKVGRDDDAAEAMVYEAEETYFVGPGLFRALVEELKWAEPVTEEIEADEIAEEPEEAEEKANKPAARRKNKSAAPKSNK